MAEDVAIFAEHGFGEDDQQIERSQDPHPHDGKGSDPHTRHRHGRREPVSEIFGTLAALTASAALLVGAAAAVRAIAPAGVAQLEGYDVRRLGTIALYCAAGAVILVAVARVVAHIRSGRQGIASSAIILLVCAGMLAGGSLLVSNMFPAGIIKPQAADTAPVDNGSRMEREIEEVTGTCASGWREADPSSYPGVSYMAVCTSSRIAFITFDSKAAAAMDASPAKQKISEMLDQYASDPQEQADWQILSGDRWIAVGVDDDLVTLQRHWGGGLSPAQ